MRAGEHQFLFEDLEELQQPPGRLLGGVEEAERCLVGRRLLRDRELEVGALRHAAAPQDRGCGDAAIAGRRSGRRAHHQRDDVLDRRVAQRFFAAREVSP